MKGLNKLIAGLLVLFLMGLYLPQKALSSAQPSKKDFDKSKITRHEPKVLSTPVKMIPTSERGDEKEKSLKKYLWIGLASVLVVGGTAAAVSAGGSDDNGKNSNSGNISLEW